MLAALLGFALICLIYSWWHLLKVFRNYKKGVDEMSNIQFYIFLLLNYLVLNLFSSFAVGYFMIGQEIIVAILIIQIIPLIISYLIFRKYRKIKKSNNDTITKTETIDM